MLALLVIIGVIVALAVVYGIAGFMFALVWNFLVPVFWHAAPHLSWMQGIAVSWMVGLLQSIFGWTTRVQK